MKVARAHGASSIALLLFAALAPPGAMADSWQPVAAEELQMTSEPKAPLAPFICLYRQIDRNDDGGSEHVYLRYKIFTEAGRKVANVAITYNDLAETVRYIEARTIRPDGTIANFDGKVYETPIAESHTLDRRQKTFALPDAQIGSIVEYQFDRVSNPFTPRRLDSRWILSLSEFTKKARFSLIPYPRYQLDYSWPQGLPPGTEAPHKEHGRIVLEAHDIPAFVKEEHMPPENSLRFRVEFIYVSPEFAQKDVTSFWTQYGKVQSRRLNDFVDKTGAMEKAVSEIISPQDSAEAKLRKIYDRVQRFHNLSYERGRSEQEVKRENIHRAENVKDIWEDGFATGYELPWLFLGLARAAGFSADPALACARNAYFFNRASVNMAQLDSSMVVVHLDGRDLYFDPGNPYVPYGQLPWADTATQAMSFDRDGGHWIDTPIPKPSEATTERRGTLAVDANGDLSGHLTFTYSGLEATQIRLALRNEDDAARRKYIEDAVKNVIPAASEVTLTNLPVWDSADMTLVAQFDLSVPGWAQMAAHQMLLPVGVFGAEERHAFEHATRVYPVYFEYPYQRVDDLTITLPDNVRIDTLPEARQFGKGSFNYQLTADSSPGRVHLRRELTVNALLLKADAYDAVRYFYQSVRAADDQQLVLTMANSGLSH